MQHKLLTLLICSWLGAVQAAELGEIAPRSYIGQPLAVDIDLLSLTPEEAAGLQVRLADANVYRGANVAMNPALASVRLQLDRRGQKPVLHVTTTRPVEAEYVHLYVQLGVPGKQDVRLATVWLQHDPNPAPPPTPAVPLASALTPAQAEQIAAQARAARATAARDGAARDVAAREAAAKETAAKEAAAKEAVAKEVAAKEAAARQAAEEAAKQAAAAPVRDRSKPAPLPSMHEAETGVPGEVKAAAAMRRIAGVWVSADGKPTKAPTSQEAAVPVTVAQALLPLAPLPLPKGVKRPATASCAPTGASAKECLALDAHNAELSSKLTELEGKMKALQGALGGAASAASKAAPAAGPAPAGPGTAAASQPAPAAKGAASAALAPAAALASAGAITAASKAPGAGGPSASGGPSGAGGSSDSGGALASAGASGSASGLGKTPGAGGAAAVGAAGKTAADGAAHGGAAAGDKPPASATVSLSARTGPEAHAAKAAAGEEGKDGGAASAAASASASVASDAAAGAAAGAATAASAASAASAPPPVATKQVRVLPKLKYKKEKPPEPQTDYTLPLAAGGVGLLGLLGAGALWWREKKSGKGPLKIWQGFRKKKAPEPEPGPEDFVEVRSAAQ